MKKIYYLSSSIIPSTTANSVQVMKMCNAFSDIGYDVTLFARTSVVNVNDIHSYYGVNSRFSIIKKHWPNIPFLGGILFGKAIKKSLSTYNSAELYYARDFYTLLWLKSKLKNVIYEAHAMPRTFIHKQLEKRIFKRKNFKRLVVISHALKNDYKRAFPFLDDKMIYVAHDAADRPNLIKANENKFKLQGEVEKTKVGYIGHLYQGKGMEIIEKLSNLVPSIEFHIIGGNKEDIDFWKSKCFNSKNIFFYGYIPHSELYKFYDQMNIFMAPYQNNVKGFGGGRDISRWMSPLKIFEYMSYKKAIIASKLPVIEEVLESYSNAILCNPNDINEWVSALEKLVNNPKLVKVLGEAAYNSYDRYYTWNQRARVVLE